MTMNARTTLFGTRAVLAVTALSCAFAGTALAADHDVTVARPVSAEGLDLSQPKDARTYYERLANAAWVVCTRGDRADLLPADDRNACYEKALGNAVRVARVPLVTQLYLTTHTLADAARYRIQVPSEVAGR
jgi:UrcA family protein